jgi:hypothetical protein
MAFFGPFLYGAAIGIGGALLGLPLISPPTISGALVVAGLTAGTLLGKRILG